MPKPKRRKKMKVTKAEVQEVIDEIAKEKGAPIEVNIMLGIEDDGDMVIVLLTTETNSNIILTMHRKVRKLGRRHMEAYYVEVMWPSWFNYYREQSGFEELEAQVESPCPLDARLWAEGVVEFEWEGKVLGRTPLENLSEIIERLKAWKDNWKGDDTDESL
jgi:hypothetical protein